MTIYYNRYGWQNLIFLSEVIEVWKNFKRNGIARIEKLVGEYNIWELNKSPYGKFKIKIFENSDNIYSGYTNILIADELGDFYCAVGYGKSEDEALENTIAEFYKMTERKEKWEEADFQCADPYDF